MAISGNRWQSVAITCARVLVVTRARACASNRFVAPKARMVVTPASVSENCECEWAEMGEMIREGRDGTQRSSAIISDHHLREDGRGRD